MIRLDVLLPPPVGFEAVALPFAGLLPCFAVARAFLGSFDSLPIPGPPPGNLGPSVKRMELIHGFMS